MHHLKESFSVKISAITNSCEWSYLNGKFRANFRDPVIEYHTISQCGILLPLEIDVVFVFKGFNFEIQPLEMAAKSIFEPC